MSLPRRNRRLYNKAREILLLSRHVSDFYLYDFSALEPNGKEHPYVYFTGDIIRQSNSLVPEILKAENQPLQDDRLRYAYSLQLLTNRLYKTCEHLEKAESNGKDFILHFRKEVKKFKSLQHKWMMSL